MATCYQCGSLLPHGGGARREVRTGTTLGLSYGRSMRSYRSIHFGSRLLCAGCAERLDEASMWAVGIIGAIVGSIIFGLILVFAGAPGAVSLFGTALLFVACVSCLVFFARKLPRKHSLPPVDRTSPHYYRSPGMLYDPFDKPGETPHGTQENTTQPLPPLDKTTQSLPPVDRTSPDYYWSPGQHGDYFDKPHD
jgi:hypothetical protein